MIDKKIAILQSNYIPWKGYFDIINSVDEFVLYDDVQYTKNDWRNRNLIKTSNGLLWLTVPVRQLEVGQLIRDTRIADQRWAKKHWSTISQSYSKALYFKEFRDIFEDLYLNMKSEFISEVNLKFIQVINEVLGVGTKLRSSNEFSKSGGQTERLIDICHACNANVYVSGPAAKSYFKEDIASASNVKVEWVDYSNYRVYSQLHGEFEHGVSILDLIFNVGPDTKSYMKSFD